MKINENDITKTCSMTDKAILLTAGKVIGKYRKKKHKWITHDIMDLCYDRRKLKEATKSNPEMEENYKQIYHNS